MDVVLCNDTDWLLSEEAFLLYASCMYRPTYENFKIQMESFLRDPSVRVFVSEDQGKKTGLMVLKCLGTAAEIVGIAVLEKLRCQGIGRRMIRFVMGSEGLERIEAQTDDDSVGFYRKCGFAETRTVIDYPDGSAVRYNCVLNKQTYWTVL
jgi:ribosomal protein S18 acetylase RimI-like enzyme